MKNFYIISLLFAWTQSVSATNFTEIAQLIQTDDQVRTVEQFLKVLSSKDPDLFSRFTLMRESQSLQGASPQDPRAIVFGKDAKFILTFNGDPAQAGYNNIEMMQFVNDEKYGARFELRELQFDPAGIHRPNLSESNPSTCTRCHGTDPKPIWEQYDKWPGAYGEVDDALIDFDDHQRYPPTGHDDPDIVVRNRLHLKQFKAFMAGKDHHLRYKNLIFPTGTDSPVAPYIPTIRSGSEPLRPNLQLSHRFSELHGKTLATTISQLENECVKDSAPIAAALMLFCDDLNENNQNTEIKRIKKELDDDAIQKPLPNAIMPVQWSLINRDTYNSGLVRLLNLMGLSDFDWSTARLKRQWSYFQGFKDGSDDVLEAMWPAFIDQGIKLPDYQEVRAALYPDYYPFDDAERPSSRVQDGREKACVGLLADAVKFSVSSFKKRCEESQLRNLPTANVIPKAALMCQTCHTSAGPGPVIAFNDKKALSRNHSMIAKIWQRIQSLDPTKKMPPERPMTIREFRELQQYLNDLAE